MQVNGRVIVGPSMPVIGSADYLTQIAAYRKRITNPPDTTREGFSVVLGVTTDKYIDSGAYPNWEPNLGYDFAQPWTALDYYGLTQYNSAYPLAVNGDPRYLQLSKIDVDTIDSRTPGLSFIDTAINPVDMFWQRWTAGSLNEIALCVKSDKTALCSGGTNTGKPCTSPCSTSNCNPTECPGVPGNYGICQNMCTSVATICPAGDGITVMAPSSASLCNDECRRYKKCTGTTLAACSGSDVSYTGGTVVADPDQCAHVYDYYGSWGWYYVCPCRCNLNADQSYNSATENNGGALCSRSFLNDNWLF
jgi:hypothetical protein